MSEDRPLKEELRKIEAFSDLGEEQLDWLASNVEEKRFETNEIMTRSGEPADHLTVILEGEIQARVDPGTPNLPAYIAGAGEITGVLPHSRMRVFGRTVRAAIPTRVVMLHRSKFPELLEQIPELESRLIGVMADRIRETAKADLQHEKLAALGKLAAGLAHELNNPAAAIHRGADTLAELLVQLRESEKNLAEATPEQRKAVLQLEEEALRESGAASPLDALTRSDREQDLGDLLSDLNVDRAWDLSPELVDGGLTRERLQQLAETAGPVLGPALGRISTTLALSRLAAEMQESAVRISALVRSVKDYSYMDTAAEQEVDIHGGIENTLTMFSHRLKRGVQIVREYDPRIPKICAHGGELNQVWTNLIDNAIDAMEPATDKEKVLTVHTALQGDSVLVEVRDNGPGVPDEIHDRICEPFFTTKKQGEGTGLGLDLVARILRRHGGDLRFESEPGSTSFQVRLPVQRQSTPQ